jgi:hypothetical protein
MKNLNKWWKDLWFPAINLWNAPHRVEIIMPLTQEEIKERLKLLDEISLLEILEISSEDIVEKFSDKIDERGDYFIKDLEEEEWDNDGE